MKACVAQLDRARIKSSVMVVCSSGRNLDFESSSPGSSPGMTLLKIALLQFIAPI